MAHRLPDVLIGNLACLISGAWPELREIIIVVDSTRGCLPDGLEEKAHATVGAIPLRFLYYSDEQARKAEAAGLPYVYAWLSWSIGMTASKTRHILLQDYDALILDDVLAHRYRKFAESGAVIQGIKWYEGNGVLESDRLATTFETFLDLDWLRPFPMIELFNKVGYEGKRSRDYDILLEIQHRYTPLERRSIEPMPDESIVHPSQMIHQYTMFRKFPGKVLPCASLLMIPFFEWMSGKREALSLATRRIEERQGTTSNFFGDDVLVNFASLQTGSVDWNLKQMVRVCLNRGVEPFADLARYGDAIYEMSGVAPEAAWVGDFTPVQRTWADAARHLSRVSAA